MADTIEIKDDEFGHRAVFKCPGCNLYHSLPIEGMQNDIAKRITWTWNEDTEKPTFKPSILSTLKFHESVEKTDEICHSYVTDGEIRFLGDCTHDLAGQTVPLNPIEGS